MAKKIKMKALKKGERCREGWTLVEVKVGRKVRRVCIHGKVAPKRSTMDKVMDAVIAVDPVFYVAKMF